MAAWNRHSLEGAPAAGSADPSAATKTTPLSARSARAAMPDAVISIPPPQRTETLPDRPGLSPLRLRPLTAATMAARALSSGGITGRPLGVQHRQSGGGRGCHAAFGNDRGDEP